MSSRSMFRLTRDFRPNGLTLASGFAMAIGALIYLNDQVPKPRNLHTFLWPALILMGIGVVLATVGAVWRK